MSSPGRPKSPSASSSNDDNVDGGKFGKSGSFGNKPKSSPGLVKWLKNKTFGSKADLCEVSPQPLECQDLPVHSPRETSPPPHEMSPEPLERALSPDNFFSFTASSDVNIWDDDDFTSILKRTTIRKLSMISEERKVAIPIQEVDGTVENIGVAYVTAERTSKLLPKEIGVKRGTSPPTLDSYQKKKLSGKSVSSASLMGDVRPRSKTDAAFLATTTSSVPVGRSYPHEAESLNRVVLLERQIEELKAARWQTPPIRETIDRILIGRSYCLEWYKSQLEKRALLDAAIDSNDGNCIITILLFIKKTVNQPILLGMLKKRPVAIRHYASFLKQLGATTELTNLYKRLDENERLADIKLQQCEAEMNPAERYAKLRDCHGHFSSSPTLKSDARHVEDYARLTNQQRMIEDMEGRGGAVVLRVGTVLFRSMVTTLFYCCRYHRSKPETNTASPVALRRQFNIPEKQYFQMCLLALCVDEDWPAIEDLVTTKGFMGIGKKKKSPIGFERIVKTIARKSLKPPIQILTKYLTEVDDIELRLQLATEVGAFQVGIDCLKVLKDKERLRNYINYIPANKQWDYRPKIDVLLANSQIKWR